MTKRIFPLFLALGLVFSLAACGDKAQPSSQVPTQPSSIEVRPGGSGESPSLEEIGPLTPEEEAALAAQAEDFAINFPDPFSSTQDLRDFLKRFTFWKLYEAHPEWEEDGGPCWVPPEAFTREVFLRFGIEGYEFVSPERENEYPRYVEEKGAIAFYTAGGLPAWVAELAESSAEGDSRFYTFDLYDDFITDGHEERTWERRLRYSFRVVRDDEGKPMLQAISAEEIKQ